MNEKDERPELPDILSTDEHRRSFIKKCIGLGGGLLIYLTPTVKAYAGGRKVLSHPGWFFDITLPANYTIVGAPITYNFAVQGQPAPIPVSFNVSGVMDLLATTDPEVATARGTITMSSVSANPLASAGIACGRLTGTLPAETILGQLNLHTGAWTPLASVSATLTSDSCPAGVAAVSQAGGGVAKSTAGDHKCSPHDIQIQTACAPGGHPTIVTGTFGTDLRVA